jgi:hypothetical protein
MLSTMEGFQITTTSHINPHCPNCYHITIIILNYKLYIYNITK